MPSRKAPRPLFREGEDYRVIEYEVWGNAKEGFDVNRMWATKTMVWIADDASDAEILTILKRAGLLKKNVRRSQIQIEAAGGDGLEIGSPKEGPLFGLQRMSAAGDDD